MNDATVEIEAGLSTLVERSRDSFARASSEPELGQRAPSYSARRESSLRSCADWGVRPPSSARSLGERVNAIKDEVEGAFEARLARAVRAARQAELEGPPFDLTLPGRVPAPRGHLHPVTRVRDEILDIFRSLGFEVAWGPEVELEAEQLHEARLPAGSPGDRHAGQLLGEVTGTAAERACCSARTRATCRSAR